MDHEKLEMIDNKEFQNLFEKSKKLIDGARSNMGQMAKEYKLYLPDKKLLQKKLKEWLDEEQNNVMGMCY